MKTRKNAKLIAEICLYGNREIGAGWLARTADGKMFGDGEPKSYVNFTTAVFSACNELHRAGYQLGKVRVFAPGGERMAETDLNDPGYYGDLKWMPATMLVVSVEEIEKHAATV